MNRATLVIDGADAKIFAEGAADVMLEAVVVVSGDGSLRDDELAPCRVEALSVLAASGDVPEQRSGPLIRVYATRAPTEDPHGTHEGHHQGA